MYDLSIELNEQQIRAVEDTDGQILVIAGAGSGKTRVLISRIAYLIKNCGVDPYEILAITFTNKAAKEMLERLHAAVGENANVWAMTFHSFCARILRRDADRIGYTSNYTIYDESDREKTIKRVCADLKIEDQKQKERIVCYISDAKSFGMTPPKFRLEYANLKDADLAATVYEQYQEKLLESNAMDFDDLLLNAVNLFLTCPDVLERYQNRFRYINVDEFQDTNATQYLLIKLLAGKHGNIFAVGDEDQSIYSWRGAEIKNILDFKKEFPEVKTYMLERNYRSTSQILNAANRLIANNKQRLAAKNLWTDKTDGEQIAVCSAGSDRDEADYVVKQIDMLRRTGYKYRDIAVLSRINALSRTFEEKFNAYGIPYKVYGGFKFYERKEVKDVLAYFKVVSNPKDEESILRIINFPKRGIGDGAINEISAFCKSEGLDLVDGILGIDSATVSTGTKKKISAFRDVLCRLMQNEQTMSMTDYAKSVLEVSGLENFYKSSEEEADRLENVNELLSSIAYFASDNEGATMSDFLQSVALVSDTDDILDDDFVTLATVHAVKGLEFAAVFIVGLEENIFPLERCVDKGELEEERRLMYVAVTRARKKLFCTYAGRRFRFNSVVYNRKSRFIDEMKGASAEKPQIPARPQNLFAPQPKTQKATTPLLDLAAKPKTISTDFSAFKVGTKVKHKKFGEGEIIAVFGDGMDMAAQIKFQTVGVKKLLLLIANLEIVE